MAKLYYCKNDSECNYDDRFLIINDDEDYILAAMSADVIHNPFKKLTTTSLFDIIEEQEDDDGETQEIEMELDCVVISKINLKYLIFKQDIELKLSRHLFDDMRDVGFIHRPAKQFLSWLFDNDILTTEEYENLIAYHEEKLNEYNKAIAGR